MKFMFPILVFLLGAGCASDPHKDFWVMTINKVGNNFDGDAKRGALYYPGVGEAGDIPV